MSKGTLHRVKAIQGVKSSLIGKKVKIIEDIPENIMIKVELLENARRFKKGEQLMFFRDSLEEEE